MQYQQQAAQPQYQQQYKQQAAQPQYQQQQAAQPQQYQQPQYQQQAAQPQYQQPTQPSAGNVAQPYIPFVAASAPQPGNYIPLAQPTQQQPQQPAPPAPPAPQAPQGTQLTAQQPQAGQTPESAATGAGASQPIMTADVAALQQRIEGLEAQLRTSVANGALYGSAPQQPQSAGEYQPFGQLQAQPQPYTRLADLDFRPNKPKE